MNRSTKSCSSLLMLLLFSGLFAVQAPVFAASESGQLSGLVLGENGQPLPQILISLLKTTSSDSFPTLARTDESGRVMLKDLEAGTYQIAVRSAEYRSPVKRLVQIVPNRTAVITLILQQLFKFTDTDVENVGYKALLRTADRRRLIFRNSPYEVARQAEQKSPRIFDDAVIQVYSNSGFGGDYFVFPGDSWAGTSTNFAVTDSVGTRGRYIFAGQLNSGHDSVWRIKNLVDYSLGETHSLRLFFAYGRMSYEQPGLALLNNPSVEPQSTEYARSEGNVTQLLSIGVEDSFSIGSDLMLTWGLEMDRLRSGYDYVSISPSAQVDYSATDSTHFRAGVTSRRPTLGNTIQLPDGQVISLASPLQISRINNNLRVGTAQYYFGSVAQSLRPDTTVELAYFDNRYNGDVYPVLAMMTFRASADVLSMPGEISGSRGYRATLRKHLLERITGQVSFVRAQAPGLSDSAFLGMVGASDLQPSVERQYFNAIATQIDTKIPSSKTQVTALFKIVPGPDPLVNLDPLSDVYETGNEGLSFFVRQIIPLPVGVLSFFGLEFLTPESIEALLDIRNLFDGDSGTIQAPEGTVALIQNPRSLRGGLSVRF